MRVFEGEADFGDVASQFSEGPEKLSRGIVGPVPLAQAHPLIFQKLKSLKSKEISSDILVINNWHLILRLEHHLPTKLDDDIESLMQKELFEEYINSEVKTMMENLLHKTKNK